VVKENALALVRAFFCGQGNLWEIPRRPDAALSRSKHGLCRSGLVREDVGTGDIFRA